MPLEISGSPLEPLLLFLAVAALSALAYFLGRRRQRISDASLSALAGVGRAILEAQLDVDALCEVVYQQSGRIVNTANYQVGLFDGDDYVIKVWVRDGVRLPPQRFAGAACEGIVGWVRAERQGLLVRDFEREWDQLPARPSYQTPHAPTRAAVFAPLVAGGQALGVIAVQSHAPGAFRDEHLRLLTVLASQAAGAFRNAQLFETERTRTQQLQLIAQVTRQLTAVQPLADLFRQIVSLVRDTFGYYVVSVFIVDAAAGLVRMGASTEPEMEAEVPTLQLGEGIVGSAAQQAVVIHVPDVAHDPRFRYVDAVSETCAEVALPLMIEDRVLGVLDVEDDRVGAFSKEDLDVLTTLAGQLALAIHEALNYDARRRQNERLTTMIEASRAMVSILDIDDLFDEMVDLVVDYFGFDRVHIFLRSGDRLVFRAGSGVHSGLWEIEQFGYNLDDPGLIPLAARTGEAVVSNDVWANPNYVPGPAVEDTRAQVSAPIRMGRLLLGVFDVQSLEPNAFSAEDVSLVQALADSMAVTVRNASLYANEQRRRLLAETLRQVGTVLTSHLELETVLDGILLALVRVVAFDIGFIMLLNDAATAYEIRAALGLPDDVLGELVPAGSVAGEEILWWLHELAERRPARAEDQRREAVITPLELSGDQIGYLVVERVGLEVFTDDERRIVEAFAVQAAVAIANAQLFEAQQEEAWVIAALLQVAQAFNREVDSDSTLNTAVRMTGLLAGVERCGILQWNPATRCFEGRAAYGLRQEAAFRGLSLNLDDWPLLERAVASSEVIWAGDGDATEAPPALAQVFESPALLGIPLATKGELRGLMLVNRSADSGVIDERRLKLLTGIAYQTALAMEAARLRAEAGERERLERELEVAREIQTSFLPEHPPQIPGWEVATFYRPARHVGGDFYDFIPLKSGRWGIVVADVADKGVPAALFMAVSRTLIRAAGLSRLSPSKTLERVNEMVLADVRSALFVTAYYQVVEPGSNIVRYAVAGHNPPLHVNAQNGVARYLLGRGMAIGVLDQISIDEHAARMDPGDVIVCYTDGVTEAINADSEEFGAERLKETVQACWTKPAAEIVAYISAAVDAFAGAEGQFDDLTLVVLKRLAA